MASKRKSTVPCMIPSKTKHMREDIILGCLPELLPTIPEDSILSISSKDENAQRFHNLSKTEAKTSCWEKGTYSCPLCGFASGDLNPFLNHVENRHTDFHTQPNFYCLSCKVVAGRFEGLALHNAKSHPDLHTMHKRVSLQVAKRDGAIAVEQTVFTEDFRESGISITKTPIMKMTKGGHKKIVVSHTVEVHKADPSKATTLTNGTSFKTFPLTALPHIIGANVSSLNKVLNTLGIPVTNTNSSHPDSNSDLPKVMIPLSSIPTYAPAMDLSSFLKMSFSKFPYPTKAELCYLTVVSGFPEEQIKLWFTAQRLKQGISWSPEEIEDTRRKMFNTVFQSAPKMAQNQSHPSMSQQSFSPSSIPQIPKGNALGCKGGVSVIQPSITQATSLKQQPVVQMPQVHIHQAISTKETGNKSSFQTTENGKSESRGSVNHGQAGKSESVCNSSFKTSVNSLPAASKSQNSSCSDGSIMNLTNIVRKINCHMNDRVNTNGTSGYSIRQASFYGQQKVSGDGKESTNGSFATTSKFNNGSTYKSTSHSTICTIREENTLDHTSKSNTETSVICSSNIQSHDFPSLTHSLVSNHGSLVNSLEKGNLLPEQPGSLKQSFIHISAPEQKQLLAPQNQQRHTLTDPTSGGSTVCKIQQTSLQSNTTTLQKEPIKNFSPSLPALQEQLSPNHLGSPQVPPADATTVQTKEHDLKHSPALEDSKELYFDAERLHPTRSRAHAEEKLPEQHSELTNMFHAVDKNEHSNSVTFTNNTNKPGAKQGMPLLRKYIQEVDQWEGDSSYPRLSNTKPTKINIIAVNKEEISYKSNSEQLICKPLENLINDGGYILKNESLPWLESYQRGPVKAAKLIPEYLPNIGTHIENNQVNHDRCLERKSIFQRLDSEAPVVSIQKMSKETEALDKSADGEQEYCELDDEEHQQSTGSQSLRSHASQDNQSRDCLRGELLKV